LAAGPPQLTAFDRATLDDAVCEVVDRKCCHDHGFIPVAVDLIGYSRARRPRPSLPVFGIRLAAPGGNDQTSIDRR
jgi:hypothetical protein